GELIEPVARGQHAQPFVVGRGPEPAVGGQSELARPGRHGGGSASGELARDLSAAQAAVVAVAERRVLAVRPARAPVRPMPPELFRPPTQWGGAAAAPRGG